MAAFAPYATLPNVTGVPAISVPHGRDGDGMPLAVQFIGPLGADGLLLRLARLCERAAFWSFPLPATA
jgi:amidase